MEGPRRWVRWPCVGSAASDRVVGGSWRRGCRGGRQACRGAGVDGDRDRASWGGRVGCHLPLLAMTDVLPTAALPLDLTGPQGSPHRSGGVPFCAYAGAGFRRVQSSHRPVLAAGRPSRGLRFSRVPSCIWRRKTASAAAAIDIDSDEFRDGRYSGDELSCGRCVEDAEIKGEVVADWTRAHPGHL